MKKAGFKYEKPNSKEIVWGTVTLKNDGKISISINDPKRYSFATRYQAKLLANKIVESDFKHEAVTYIEAEDNSLVDILKAKTTDLKERYIQSVKDWAKRRFTTIENQIQWTEQKWYDYYNVKYTIVDERGKDVIKVDTQEYNKKGYFKVWDDLRAYKKIVKLGFDTFEAKEIKSAERHYNDSITKLSDRLIKKGITDGSTMEIIKAWVGVNLEMTIKSGDIITRAWTIVAEGEIQRPHYRYLIK